MSRGVHGTAGDPIAVLRSNGVRNMRQAADFLQLVGYPVTAGYLDQRERDGKLDSFVFKGKIQHSKLLKLVRKSPDWLDSLPSYGESGKLTIREAMKTLDKVRLEDILVYIEGSKAELRNDGTKRYLVIPVEFFLDLVISDVFKLEPLAADEVLRQLRNKVFKGNDKPEASTGVKGTTGSKANHQVKPRKERKLRKPAKSAPAVQIDVQEISPATPLTEAKAKVEGKKSIVNLKFAAEYLQVCGYRILARDLYHKGVIAKKKVFRAVKRGHYWYVDEAYLEKIAENPPKWLQAYLPGNLKVPYEAPEGYSLSREVILDNGFDNNRYSQACAAGLIRYEEYNSGKNQGKIFVVSGQEIERINNDPLLVQFLHRDKVTIPEILEASRKRAEPQRKNQEIPGSEADPEAEILSMEPLPAPEIEVLPLVGLLPSATDILTEYAYCKQYVSALEEAAAEGLMGEALATRLAPFHRKLMADAS